MIAVQGLDLIVQGSNVFKQLSFDLGQSSTLAITGAAGVGKTTLGRILAGELQGSHGTVRYAESLLHKEFVAQQQNFRGHFTNISYYQQRYDYNYFDTSPLTSAFIGEVAVHTLPYYQGLKIDEIKDKYLISLSNGEAKRVQLFKALQQQPDLLVLDNPFVGLDVEMRAVLGTILQDLVQVGVVVVLICPLAEIPTFFTKLLVLDADGQYQYGDQTVLQVQHHSMVAKVSFDDSLIAEIQTLSDPEPSYMEAARLEKVHIKFRDRILLPNLDWVVKKGERWALIGPNGSGKSTLLSLIAADNPQVYANDVWVFDHKRGSGESVWDIKKKIGIVSPELHIYFLRENKHAYNAGQVELDHASKNMTVFEVIASGLDDHQEIKRNYGYRYRHLVSSWMQLLEIGTLKEEKFYRLSLGMQRIVLLARALVKNPPLLILDEPTQGLDSHQIQVFNQLVDHVATKFEKTLIYVSHYQEHLPTCIQKKLYLKEGTYWVE